MIKHLKGAAFAASICLSGVAHAAIVQFGSGDVTSGSFGDSHIAAGDFTDTLAFDLTAAGKFSASITSAATTLGQAGDIDFTRVVLTGPNGPFNFTIRNNDNADGLTDSAVLTKLLDPGSYLVTISGHSFGDAQYGGNTSFRAAAVPEPASWAMFIGGFGLLGAATRRRKAAVSFG
jgi:hypothetical protein